MALMPRLQQAFSLLENEQESQFFQLLDQLEATPDQQDCLRMYLQCLRVEGLMNFAKSQEAWQQFNKTLQQFGQYAMPYFIKGLLLLNDYLFIEALEAFEEAKKRYPKEATEARARLLIRMGHCQAILQRPLAAYANWMQAAKIPAVAKDAQEALNHYHNANPTLPQQVKHGLGLLAAPAIPKHDAERRQRWDKAIKQEKNWQLEDLVSVFTELSRQDPNDKAAWYNLGLAYAWLGRNGAAIEALDRYVILEEDFNQAADAWDLAELLRIGGGAESYSDTREYFIQYNTPNINQFVDQLLTHPEIVLIRTEPEDFSFRWFNRQPFHEADTGLVLLGGLPYCLGEVVPTAQYVVIRAWDRERFQDLKQRFQEFFGEQVTLVEEGVENLHTKKLFQEPLFDILPPRRREPMQAQVYMQSAKDAAQRFWEETWIHRPLQALDGLAPVDAACSPLRRKKLEGVIRFRERVFSQYKIPYDFEQLRNKLGLVDVSESPLGHKTDLEIASYSAAQLANLNVAGLADEDLIIAYRTAVNLQAMATASNMLEEMKRRDRMPAKINLSQLVRRLIIYRLEQQDWTRAERMLAEASKFDQEHYQGENLGGFGYLQARLLLEQEANEELQAKLAELSQQFPKEMAGLAELTESLLSKDRPQQAAELADRGLKLAESSRNREYQARFRELLNEARSRTV